MSKKLLSKRKLDVGGIFTADPHICPNTHLIEEISYEEMLEMVSGLSSPIHPRAVELAWRYNVPVLITSIANYPRGTLIHNIL